MKILTNEQVNAWVESVCAEVSHKEASRKPVEIGGRLISYSCDDADSNTYYDKYIARIAKKGH